MEFLNNWKGKIFGSNPKGEIPEGDTKEEDLAELVVQEGEGDIKDAAYWKDKKGNSKKVEKEDEKENPMDSAFWEQNPMGKKRESKETKETKESKLSGTEYLFTRKVKKEKTQEIVTEEVKIVFAKGENSGDVGGKMIIEGKEEEITEIRRTSKSRIYITEKGTYEISNEKYAETKISSAEKANKSKEESLTKSKGYLSKILEKSTTRDKKIALLIAAGLVGLTIAIPVGGVAAGWFEMGLAQATIGHGILYGAAADFFGIAAVAGAAGGGYVLRKLMEDARELVNGGEKKPKPEPITPDKTPDGKVVPDKTPDKTPDEKVVPGVENVEERIEGIKKRIGEIEKTLAGAENIKKTKELYEKSIKDLEEGAEKIQKGINELGDDAKEIKKSMEQSLLEINKNIENLKKQVKAFDTYLSSDIVKKLQKELEDLKKEEKELVNKQPKDKEQKKEPEGEENEDDEMFERYDGTGADYEEEEEEKKIKDVLKKESVAEENEDDEMFERDDGLGINYGYEEDEKSKDAPKKESQPVQKPEKSLDNSKKQQDRPVKKKVKPVEKVEPKKIEIKEEEKDETKRLEEFFKKNFGLDRKYSLVREYDEEFRKAGTKKKIDGKKSNDFKDLTGFGWSDSFNVDDYILRDAKNKIQYIFEERIKSGGKDLNEKGVKNIMSLNDEEKQKFIEDFGVQIEETKTPQEAIDLFSSFNSKVVRSKE